MRRWRRRRRQLVDRHGEHWRKHCVIVVVVVLFIVFFLILLVQQLKQLVFQLLLGFVVELFLFGRHERRWQLHGG